MWATQVFLECILYTSELFYAVGNHIVFYADNTTTYAVLPRPLSHLKVMEYLHQDMAAVNFWCLNRQMRTNPKKTNSMRISRSRTYAPSIGDFTLGGAELEEAKSQRILGVTLDSKLTFETRMREIVWNAVKSIGVVGREGKLFDYLCLLKSCFNYIFCPTWRIVPPCGYRLLSLICVGRIMLFELKNICVRMNFVVWRPEESLVLVFALKIYHRAGLYLLLTLITERTTVCRSI